MDFLPLLNTKVSEKCSQSTNGSDEKIKVMGTGEMWNLHQWTWKREIDSSDWQSGDNELVILVERNIYFLISCSRVRERSWSFNVFVVKKIASVLNGKCANVSDPGIRQSRRAIFREIDWSTVYWSASRLISDNRIIYFEQKFKFK